MKIGETFVAQIESLTTNRMGDRRSEKCRVTATYEIANVVGSITFDVPITDARRFHVGQRLTIGLDVEPEKEASA